MKLKKGDILILMLLVLIMSSCGEDEAEEVLVEEDETEEVLAAEEEGTNQQSTCYAGTGTIKVLSKEIIKPDVSGAMVEYISIDIDGNNHLAITYHDRWTGGHVWLDENGNGAFDEGEDRQFGVESSKTGSPSAMTVRNGRMAVGYRDSDGILKLWLDANGNGIEDEGETNVIDGEANVKYQLAIEADSEGRLVIVYYDFDVGGKMWIDENNNGQNDGNEVRSTSHDGMGGRGKISVLVDSDDRINVTSSDHFQWEVWTDDDKDYIQERGEDRVIADPDPEYGGAMIAAQCAIAEDGRGHLAAIGHDPLNINLWVDSNDNKMGDPSEFNQVGSVFPTDETNMDLTADCNGNLAMVYNNAGQQIILWLDMNGNGAADEGETITVDDESSSGTVHGLHPSIAIGPDGNLVIAYGTFSPWTLRLATISVE